MEKTKQLQRKQLQKETSKKNFRYNRFLLLRYTLAFFFFVNLHLVIFLALGKSLAVIWPLALLFVILPAVFEHVKLYGASENDSANQLHASDVYLRIQLIVNGLLLLSAGTGIGFQTVLPFLSNTSQTRIFLAILVLLGTALVCICLKRISAIRSNQDKHYQYIQKFEKM